MHISLRRATLAAALAVTVVSAGAFTSYAAHNRAAMPGQLGMMHMQAESIYQGYYDSHKDTYINTDVSNKAQATALHINYTPLLSGTTSASSPMYFVQGRSAAGQLAVFGSEPPDKAYSPLWQEYIVTWKASSKPVLLTSDNQIMALSKKGKLNYKKTSVILNAPILKMMVH